MTCPSRQNNGARGGIGCEPICGFAKFGDHRGRKRVALFGLREFEKGNAPGVDLRVDGLPGHGTGFRSDRANSDATRQLLAIDAGCKTAASSNSTTAPVATLPLAPGRERAAAEPAGRGIEDPQAEFEAGGNVVERAVAGVVIVAGEFRGGNIFQDRVEHG